MSNSIEEMFGRDEWVEGDLRRFLAEWLYWAENGAPQSTPYYRGDGLCAAVYDWQGRSVMLGSYQKKLVKKLGDWLEDLYGDRGYPFGKQDYLNRAYEHTMHECPRRLEFARAIVGDKEYD